MYLTTEKLSKETITYRFRLAVCAILDEDIANSQSDIACDLGVKPQKFSEIMNGRMKVGVDMVAAICEKYLVSAEWILTGRGDSIFRITSQLPHGYDDEDDVPRTHPWNKETEAESEESKNAPYPTDPLVVLIMEKDKLLMHQAELIGKLKTENQALIQRLEKSASDVNIEPTAHVG